MPRSSTRKRSNGWINFVVGAVIGLGFSVGIFIITKPVSEPIFGIILHLLTPAGLGGFIAVVVGDWLRDRAKSSRVKYAVYALVCSIGGLLAYIVLAVVSNRPMGAIGLYFAIWIGGVVGLAFRLSMDEIITDNVGDKNDSEKSD